jgi:hypothetical protein
MSYCDEELGIENPRVSIDNFLDSHRVHVMDIDPVVDLVIVDAQITTIVSDNNVIAYLAPLSGPIKLLVEVSVEAECHFADLAAQGEIFETIFVRIQSPEF